MKKILALVFSIMLVMGLSVTAFAYDSPTGIPVNKISFLNGIDGQVRNSTVAQNGTFALSTDSSKGTFNKWTIFKEDGTVAKEGVDYKYTSGNATDPNAVIMPLTDLKICGNYGGKITDPATGVEAKSSSPKTGDFTVVYLAFVLMAALSCGFVAKKQLSK